jgi:hypothetical protein
MKRMHIWNAAILATAFTVTGQMALAQQNNHQGKRMPGMAQGQHMMGPGIGRGKMGRGMMQGGMMGRDCPMMGMMTGGGENTFAKGRIAFLKAELGITDGQKTVFDAYAAALKDNLESMRGMHQAMMGAMSSETPVERLDAHLGMMENRMASLKEVKPKLQVLYAALSDDQKKKANTVLTGMGCMM